MSNKELVLAIYRNFERRDVAATRALISPAMTAHIGGQVMSLDHWQAFGGAFMEAFPDGVHHWEVAVEAGDYVLLQGHFTGTHRAAFMGLAPTAKPFHLPMFTLSTVKDEQIVYERRIYDFTGMLVQIGVLKAKPV